MMPGECRVHNGENSAGSSYYVKSTSDIYHAHIPQGEAEFKGLSERKGIVATGR